MSTTIHWRPSEDRGKPFKGGTSATLAVLEAVFGYEIGPSNIPALRAMHAATKDSFYEEVADITEKIGTIKIWSEY